MAFFLLLAGCHSFTTARIDVTAPSANVPVSLTSGLVDDQGLVDPRRIHKVATFTYETGDCVDEERFDFSKAVNEQVARAGGDAVVRLEVTARRKTDCVEAKLEGDIVRVDP
jgi:hypothetical protein